MANTSKAKPTQLEKCPTGIAGLDDITHGGLPQGRPTLVCGGPGCGKSLLAIEFLIRGITQFNEPGVLMTFEETEEDIRKNVASLGFDIDKLIRQKKLAIDHVHIDRQEIEENGEYDLEGLFVRLAYQIDAVGAKRVVLDTIESIFAGLNNQAILRSELRRLFGWLKSRGMTTIITGERGDATLTRQGLEEYVSDCVIMLDHHIREQISTRRMRVVKYRGSTHGTNEYPFLIDEEGLSVLPITSVSLHHKASKQRIPTGIERLDAMLGGKGYYRGSSVLVTGTAGTGKSTIAGTFADAACARGERCLYFAFEESQGQIIRNTSSVGLDLERWVNRRLLKVVSTRPTYYGLEMHLAVMHKQIAIHKPDVVVFDPISNLKTAGTENDLHITLVRLVDFLKNEGITSLFTTLTSNSGHLEETQVGISSVMDTWLLLRDIEYQGERTRGLYVLKSRGMPHSNQIREFKISSKGIQLLDVYVGPSGVLTGSARLAQESDERAEHGRREQEHQRGLRELERKRRALEAHIALLREEAKAEEEQMEWELAKGEIAEKALVADRVAMGKSRGVDRRG